MTQEEKERQAIILDFGDYCTIEQYRYGCDNEQYVHKVIGRLRSNTWVDVPVKHVAKEVIHAQIEDVVACICCGVSETEVLKYRASDVVLNKLTELRKPSEDICPKCGYPIRLQGNGIMERICTCNHAKPSEDLIKEILIILDEHSDTDESGASFLLGGEYEEIASEIAKLLASFRSQQNDVNVELLEAAKYFRDAWNCEWSKLTAKTDDINKHNTAISNAEKQIKP